MQETNLICNSVLPDLPGINLRIFSRLISEACDGFEIVFKSQATVYRKNTWAELLYHLFFYYNL